MSCVRGGLHVLYDNSDVFSTKSGRIKKKQKYYGKIIIKVNAEKLEIVTTGYMLLGIVDQASNV